MEMVEPLGDTEGVYLEMALSGQQEITEKDMVKMAEMLEEYAHVDTQLRELEMLDSSEVTKGRSALLLAWEEEVHVESMKKLLGVSTFVPPDDSTALANVKIEPMCEGWAAKWTATVGDQELLLYIYAAGEGKRLRGLIDATLAVPMGDGGEEEGEIEHVSVTVEKEQLIKVLSRRLGVPPRGASRAAKMMTLARKQQDSLIAALTIMETGSAEPPKWEEMRAPRPLGNEREGRKRAVTAVLYSLKRVGGGEVNLFNMTQLKEMQRDETAPPPPPGRPPKMDDAKGLLLVGRPQGATGTMALSFEREQGEAMPRVSIMGFHACVDEQLRTAHAEGAPCVAAMRLSMKRKLPVPLRVAGRQLMEALGLRGEDQCPLFEMMSVKKRQMSPCDEGKGCKQKLWCCAPRFGARGKAMPIGVRDTISAWEQAETERELARRAEERARERSVSEVVMPGTPRRSSPRNKQKCGECGEMESGGRRDEHGGWYCLGCWARFEAVASTAAAAAAERHEEAAKAAAAAEAEAAAAAAEAAKEGAQETAGLQPPAEQEAASSQPVGAQAAGTEAAAAAAAAGMGVEVPSLFEQGGEGGAGAKDVAEMADEAVRAMEQELNEQQQLEKEGAEVDDRLQGETPRTPRTPGGTTREMDTTEHGDVVASNASGGGELGVIAGTPDGGAAGSSSGGGEQQAAARGAAAGTRSARSSPKAASPKDTKEATRPSPSGAIRKAGVAVGKEKVADKKKATPKKK